MGYTTNMILDRISSLEKKRENTQRSVDAGCEKPYKDHGIFFEIKKEIASARKKFPDSNLLLAALTEEVGELAHALLETRRREGFYEKYNLTDEQMVWLRKAYEDHCLDWELFNREYPTHPDSGS